MIAAGEISEFAKRTLEVDGWQVLPATTVQNPNMRDDGEYPARFWAVYTKITVFNMLEYDKGAILPPDDMIACVGWHWMSTGQEYCPGYSWAHATCRAGMPCMRRLVQIDTVSQIIIM